MNKYPEHEKMRAVHDDSHKIGDFIEWLHDNQMAICEAVPHKRLGIEYERTTKSIEQLLADYFEINLKKISDEKDAMVREIQGENE